MGTRLARWLIFETLAFGLAFGQAPQKPPAFEAASVKPANPAGGPFGRTMGGPGTTDPGRIRYANMSLKSLLLLACEVNDFQIEGPGWLDTDRFDIDAALPAGATREQFREMLRNLLVERFQIALHRETKDAPAYTLLVDRNGPRIARSTPFTPAPEGASPASVPPRQFERDRDGFPKLPPAGPPGMLQFVVPPRARLTGRLQTMGDLAGRLSYLLGHLVTDVTALTGTFDFTLTFAAEGTALARTPGGDAPNTAGADSPPDLFTAIQSQLGLKLEARKSPTEFIVIDHVSRTPVPN